MISSTWTSGEGLDCRRQFKLRLGYFCTTLTPELDHHIVRQNCRCGTQKICSNFFRNVGKNPRRYPPIVRGNAAKEIALSAALHRAQICRGQHACSSALRRDHGQLTQSLPVHLKGCVSAGCKRRRGQGCTMDGGDGQRGRWYVALVLH